MRAPDLNSTKRRKGIRFDDKKINLRGVTDLRPPPVVLTDRQVSAIVRRLRRRK